MTDAELTNLEVHELASIIESGEVSPEEITEAFLARIDVHNGSLNAYVTVDEEGARAAAKTAEKEFKAGNYRGALHGIPVAHKDLYATAGLRTTGGSRVLENNVPVTDATVVARLKAAVMVTLGKANTLEFA
mgnify:CR=1 FL=1